MTAVRSGQVALRPLQESDLDQVTAIERAAYPQPWTRQHFRDELMRSCAHCLVALGEAGGDRLLGYLIWWLVVDEAQILNLAIAPAARRRGVATTLLGQVLAEARAAGAAIVWLEVRASNIAAQTLYAAHGFVQSGRRACYYQPDGEDAVVMQCRFS
jgi:[ribosomal protein S18]-alanine N-acetyltransferase